MPLVNFSNLDFDQIKTSLKDYLKANSNFTDYDFEGSNLSTIIDVLAYNTYITSYNTNMVTNEVFIDSATLRQNVVSLARNVGYLPRSRKASKANISFNIDVNNTQAASITLKAGICVTTSSRFASNNFTFIVPSDITVPVGSDGFAKFSNIDVYQGTWITQAFSVSSRLPNQKFILSNPGIDTDLLNVNVRESETSTVQQKYTLSDSLFEVTSKSTIYYIKEIDDERYEILFGDGVFGKKLEEPNYITISYPVCAGPEADNIDKFRFSGSLVDNNGIVINNGISLITTNTASYGGKDIETTESIKKYATQIYSSQNRAVTAADYEAIVPILYPETESVSAFGGEVLTPPAYGKVFISVKPNNGVYLSGDLKENLVNNLKKHSVVGIVPEIVDLKYLYVETDVNAYYNTDIAPSSSYIRSLIIENIQNYSNSRSLNRFGARFKYSKFQKIVDDSHASITSNITTVIMRRDLEPVLNSFTEYEICYGNRFHVRSELGYNIKSSGFKVSGISDTVYFGDIPNSDLKTGTIFLFKLNSPTEPVILKQSIGTIDYVKGEIVLNPINIISTSIVKSIPLIEISVSPYSNDVIGYQDLYLQLDPSSSIVSTLADNISSGNDVSGTNYNVSSSYTNGTLIRS
jgi:hypothetical protein